jgi:outer membrane immunogenic protein
MSGISGVNAADTVPYEKPVVAVDAPEFAWSGGYVGGQVGYGWGKSHFTSRGFSPENIEPDGFAGGFYAGYNFDLGNNIILGVDGDVTYNTMKDRYTEDFGGVLDGAENELRWSGAVRGRAGYAAGRFFPYIAGGVAFGSVKNVRYFHDVVNAEYFSALQSKTLTGWTAGAGIDYAVTHNVILRLEYRYTDYGSKDFSASRGFVNFKTGNDFKTSDVRLGIGYKF